MKALFLYIFIIFVLSFNTLGFPQIKEDSSDNKYSKDLYGSEVEEPQTYESGSSPYDGVTSVEGIQRMLEDIKRLNEMQTLKEEGEEEINLIYTGLELPRLSEVFGASVSLRAIGSEKENTIPEREVAMRKVAEAIIEELENLESEGRLPLVYIMKGEGGFSEKEKEETSSTSSDEESTESENRLEEETDVYEKEIEFEEGAVTISYLIFGKRVIIDIPLLRSAEGFEVRMEALKRHLEHMATLLEEIGRER